MVENVDDAHTSTDYAAVWEHWRREEEKEKLELCEQSAARGSWQTQHEWNQKAKNKWCTFNGVSVRLVCVR